MAAFIRKLFHRKKPAPLVCSVSLDEEGNPVHDHPDHVHTDACFVSFEPLAVAELFQSQSCTACAPALPGIHAGTSDPNVLLLTYPVTIFDHTGWKDTFSNLSNDARQRAYAKRWARNNLFTPQVVVNGIVDGSGRQKEEIQALIQQARDAGKTRGFNAYLDANDTEVRLDTDKQEVSAPYEVSYIVYAQKDQTVKVSKGPNKGKKIPHRNVVESVTKIGDWVGGNATWYLPAPRTSLAPDQGAAVILTEGGLGGPIIAAAKV
ncbi:thioredoxin-like protein [Trichoderma evansii]